MPSDRFYFRLGEALAVLVREWRLLKSYRRPHVHLSLVHCQFRGAGTLDTAPLVQALCDARVLERYPNGDLSIVISGVVFDATPLPPRTAPEAENDSENHGTSAADRSAS